MSNTLSVSKWGNSLAVRIPTEVARLAGLREGDKLEARLGVDGALSLRPANWDRRSFLRDLSEFRKSIPQGTSVIDEMRRGGRY